MFCLANRDSVRLWHKETAVGHDRVPGNDPATTGTGRWQEGAVDNAIGYVVWDWNGTLFDDVSASVRSINVMLRKRALPGMDFLPSTRRDGRD